jgi:hypothetical protein
MPVRCLDREVVGGARAVTVARVLTWALDAAVYEAWHARSRRAAITLYVAAIRSSTATVRRQYAARALVSAAARAGHLLPGQDRGAAAPLRDLRRRRPTPGGDLRGDGRDLHRLARRRRATARWRRLAIPTAAAPARATAAPQAARVRGSEVTDQMSMERTRR